MMGQCGIVLDMRAHNRRTEINIKYWQWWDVRNFQVDQTNIAQKLLVPDSHQLRVQVRGRLKNDVLLSELETR